MVLPGETAEEEVACEDNLAHASMVCAARAAARGVARRALCAAIFHTAAFATLSLLPHFRGVIFRHRFPFVSPKGNQTWLAPCLAKHDHVGRSRRAAVQADTSTSAATRRRRSSRRSSRAGR